MNRYLALAMFFVFLIPVVNDIEDTLVHHYEKSIFNPGSPDNPDYSSWWYPDWQRKYIMDTTWVTKWQKVACALGDTIWIRTGKEPKYTIIKRKTFFNFCSGIKIIDYLFEIPAWWYDAWHFVKVIRWWLIFNALWLLRNLTWIRCYGGKWKKSYFKWLIRYFVLIYMVHLFFYDSLFMVGGK